MTEFEREDQLPTSSNILKTLNQLMDYEQIAIVVITLTIINSVY